MVTNRSYARKIRAQPKNVAIYKIMDLSNLLKPCFYLALKLVPSLTGLRTVDSIGKQEFGRLLQNSNWTLHCCVRTVSFANRQIETRIVIVKQIYVLPFTITIVCFLMKNIRVTENNTTLPSELILLSAEAIDPLNLLVSPLHPILQLPFRVPRHIYNYS